MSKFLLRKKKYVGRYSSYRGTGLQTFVIEIKSNLYYHWICHEIRPETRPSGRGDADPGVA